MNGLVSVRCHKIIFISVWYNFKIPVILQDVDEYSHCLGTNLQAEFLQTIATPLSLVAKQVHYIFVTNRVTLGFSVALVHWLWIGRYVSFDINKQWGGMGLWVEDVNTNWNVNWATTICTGSQCQFPTQPFITKGHPYLLKTEPAKEQKMICKAYKPVVYET